MKKMFILLAFVACLLSCGKTPQVNVSVVTEGSSEITSTSVVLSGSYTCSFSDVDLKVVDYGFYYGRVVGSLDQKVGLNSNTKVSDSYKATISSLEPNTQYFFRAYILVLVGGVYTEYLGSLSDFKSSEAPQSDNLPQYLGCYEMPAMALKNPKAGYSNTGKEKFGDTNWFNYDTTDEDQIVITHTYSDNGKTLRNWTALVDKNTKAPVWSAFVMQNDAYRRAGVGRVGDWTSDPGVPSSWQQNSANGEYNRGHFVASNYRQATADANKQTFYSTNQALQSITFNSGVWNDLELAVVGHTPSGKDTLYVVVGVLYETENIQNGIPCPSHFYKLLMNCSFDNKGKMSGAKGVAYLFENKPQTGSYNLGVTTIDAIEQRSGFDFFTNVPEALQKAAESTNTPLWK